MSKEFGFRLGERLLSAGKVSERDLERALHAQQEMGGLIGEVMVRLGLVAERDVVIALADQLNIPYRLAQDLPSSILMPPGVSPEFLRGHLIFPFMQDERGLHAVFAHPEDEFHIKALSLATGQRVVPYAGESTALEKALPLLLDSEAEAVQTEETTEDAGVGREFIEHLRDLASEAPVIRLVNQILTDALDRRASDIHVEPFEDVLHLRFRIDGVLHMAEGPPAALAAAVISRIKLLAGLNIAERRLPQDGRIKMRIKGREIDLRVSTVPTVHGESVVLRVLDRASVRFGLGDMGFSSDHLSKFQDLLARPHGILLITGPTGSGKTTTLYAALSTLDAKSLKIITVEDPVEYELSGINQIQVHPGIGLTFAHALRSILRQDPDIIMIGEMRDTETAEIAVQSALTGHLVLSTLHTNTAAGAVTRLQDMGIPRYLITSSVNGVLAQRLVRRLCVECRRPVRPSRSIIESVGMAADTDQPVFGPQGCGACQGTGYRGRTAIHELLLLDQDLQEAILQGADANAIHRMARQKGMRTLYEDGLRAVLNGLTSLEEVIRVTQDADDA